MRFTFEAFWERRPGDLVLLFDPPLTLDISSADEARRIFDKVVLHPAIPVHSVRLTSEDGSISERWFQLDGRWRRKDSSGS
ncbi:MAG: hypothetical protein P4M09_13115 [Devosia sp.]|nr:hypothetical protein [Devosia sp.]